MPAESPGARWVGSVRFHGLLLPPTAARGPAVLLQEERPAGAAGGRGLAVWDSDRIAASRGVHPGQPAEAVRAVCPEAWVGRFDRAAASPLFAPAWDLLAAAAPVVEPDPDGRPEACVAWRGGPAPRREVIALQEAVARALPHVDMALGLGRNRLVARAARPSAGPGCAWAAPGAEARLLASLSLEWLVQEGLLVPARLAALRNLGLSRCGDLASLPEGVVAGRLGPEGLRLRALCRGEDACPVEPVYPPRELRVRRAWPDGLPAGDWAAAAAELASRAAAGLAPAEGVRRLRLRGDFPEMARAWPAPRRAAGVLARAAAALAAAAAARAGPVGDAVREGCAPRPGFHRLHAPSASGADGARGITPDAAPSAASIPVPEPLVTGFLEVALEDRAVVAARPVALLPAASARPRGADGLDDLLERLPQGVLRRGAGTRDRHEALLALLDPWQEGPAE